MTYHLEVLHYGQCVDGSRSGGGDLSSQEQKTEKHNIPGGIEDRIKTVDVEGHKLTITTSDGAARTFTITEETIMMGPRGGKVRHRLKDHRFYEGFHVTIVAKGTIAEEVHLGFAREENGKTAEHEVRRPSGAELEKSLRRPETGAEIGAGGKVASKPEEDDQDDEVPGRIVRMDPTRRILVIALLNGKERSFLLRNDLPILVKGVVSTHGLREPALKAGAHVEVVTDEGGHKVKEVKVLPASEGRSRKAG
jgi:hypothetical protein